MNALISGTAGKALLVDGKSLMSFDVDDPSKLVVRQQSDLPYLFGEGRDLRIIENSDVDSIARELESESNLALALDLTLIALDDELERDIRRDALRDLNELLSDYQLSERLEGILYARPLPEDGNLGGVLNLCDKSILPHSFALLEGLERRQSLIEKVSAAWDVIPTKVFGDHEQQSHFQRVAVQRGMFRSLVVALEAPAIVSKFLLNWGLDGVVRRLRNHMQVLQEWSAPFQHTIEKRTIKHDPNEEFEREVEPRRRRGRRIGVDRVAVLTEVNRRKAIISGAIQRRELGLVHELVEDLINFQRNSGETKHLAKSLCDLAMEAKELGQFPLQLELTKQSIGEAPDDSWSWAQHGDALLNNQNLDEALAAYQEADAFGGGVIAKNGRAEVLKAKGELEPALAAYNEVISQHPEDAVAKNGRAEVLKAKGELDASLAAYNEVISQDPDNVFAKNGRAEVLKAKGELDASLAAYNEVIRQHPGNAVAKNGRADVLKAKGELDASLAAYNEVISQDPDNVFAKTGRAEVLKAKGELDASLAAYNEVISRHPENAVAKSGRAEVLKAKGELDASLAAYNEIISQHPEDRVAGTGRVSILAATRRYDEALEALSHLSAKEPTTLDDWIDYHILGMIRLRTGKIAEAIRIFNEGIRSNPLPSSRDYFSRALGLAWLRGRDFQRAGQALDEVKSPLLQPTANVLRIHAFGAQGNIQRATIAYESLSSAPHLRLNDLTQELHHQFILRKPPRRDEHWIIDREDEIVLLAA